MELPDDCIIHKMIDAGLALTVKNYLTLAYFGDLVNLDDLPETKAEIDQLVEEGILVDTESNQAN